MMYRRSGEVPRKDDMAIVMALSDVIIIVTPRNTSLQKNIFASTPWWKEADHGEKTVLIVPRCQHL
jgi:hypothetical protein